MTKESATLVREVLEFWLGPHGHPERGTMRKMWFDKNPELDAEIKHRFLDDVTDAGRGVLDGLTATCEGVLTLLILLDQFPRNMFRGEARAYAYDAKARAVARLAVRMGLDKPLSATERMFIYLPFQHSEEMDDQVRSVALFKTLPIVPWRDEVIGIAIQHHDIIARFGRFPHRNAVLGRVSTAEELTFLLEPGSGY
ncbi:MAG TPA: DUF924 family protein [Alphaproteobacteria bacterium]